MATRKPGEARRRARSNRPILVSGAEKAARANIVKGTALAVLQAAQRVNAASRGALAQRRLRAGGTELSQYDSNRFGNTYGAAVPTPKPKPTGPSGGGDTERRTTGGGSGTRSRVNRRDPGRRGQTKKGIIAGKGGGQERGEIRKRVAPRRSETGGQQESREARQEELRRKREEAARKAAAAKRKRELAGGGNTRARIGGGNLAS